MKQLNGLTLEILLPLPPNYHHVPLFVRTDTVEALATVLQETYEMKLSDSIETMDRPVDVSHFWPLDLVVRCSCDATTRE